MRRFETQDGPRRYPRTITWTGAYHGISVTITIVAFERRVFEWAAEIEGGAPRNSLLERLENVTTSELAALRAALGRVEFVHALKLARPAMIIRRRRVVEPVAILLPVQTQKELRERARRERIARTQPSLPGFE